MSTPDTTLSGLVPEHLRVRSARILLDSLEVQADIGFHEFEIGAPQRLLVTVEIWLEDAAARRYNLQETLAHALFERIAAVRGVADLRIRTSKPDIYPDAAGVGLEIASFSGAWPKE